MSTSCPPQPQHRDTVLGIASWLRAVFNYCPCWLFCLFSVCSQRGKAWQECAAAGEWDSWIMPQVQGDISQSAHSSGAGGPTQDLWLVRFVCICESIRNTIYIALWEASLEAYLKNFNCHNNKFRLKTQVYVIQFGALGTLIYFFLQVTFTGNTMTYWGCLSMGAFLQKATTCFWVTMWTGGSSLWKPFVSCWPTKSNIQRTSSCWGETTSVLRSTEYMVSMTSVSTVPPWLVKLFPTSFLVLIFITMK